jgi:2-oxoglutarate ferredoxin oxidoreductase subunit gamma
MLIKSVFAGFGGQGILMMGYALAFAAMKEEKHVTYLPSYGAEVRGGTANCTVSVGDEEIASPIASTPDFLVVMNAPSMGRFQSQVRKGGTCLINSSLVGKQFLRKDIQIYEVPAADVAEALGDIRTANMVMLGAFMSVSKIVRINTLISVLPEIFSGKKKEVLAMNEEAIIKGADRVTRG